MLTKISILKLNILVIIKLKKSINLFYLLVATFKLTENNFNFIVSIIQIFRIVTCNNFIYIFNICNISRNLKYNLHIFPEIGQKLKPNLSTEKKH